MYKIVRSSVVTHVQTLQRQVFFCTRRWSADTCVTTLERGNEKINYEINTSLQLARYY